ncbi:MAG: hypothetical protein EAZ55_01000 [Cytophagales bacterium]|nr:MAG: hypothetical protein EAZ55_01000 [Cytophagales bacterium]
MEVQSQILENLFDASKKIQETVTKGNTLEKANDLFKDWYAKQQETFEKLTSGVKEKVNVDYVPSLLKDIVSAQMKFNEQLVSSIKEVAQNYSTNKALNTYQEQTNKLYDTWKDAHEKLMSQLGKPFNELKYNPAEIAKEVHNRVIDAVRKYATEATAATAKTEETATQEVTVTEEAPTR